MMSTAPEGAPVLLTKTYGPEEGLSCCFRQWRAASHCRHLHGYALGFCFTFAADRLDESGWVIDFGALLPLREWLHEMFDHTLLAAADDPELPRLQSVADADMARLHVLPAIGCEAFADLALSRADGFARGATAGRVRAVCVDVFEHAGNSVRKVGAPPQPSLVP